MNHQLQELLTELKSKLPSQDPPNDSGKQEPWVCPPLDDYHHNPLCVDYMSIALLLFIVTSLIIILMVMITWVVQHNGQNSHHQGCRSSRTREAHLNGMSSSSSIMPFSLLSSLSLASIVINIVIIAKKLTRRH